MPLSNVTDPVIREIRVQRSIIQYLVISTAILYLVLAASLGAAVYLRSNDLEGLAHQANVEQVRTCFRSSNQRSQFTRILGEPTLAEAIKDLLRSTIANTPTVLECQMLATQLHVPVPEVN